MMAMSRPVDSPVHANRVGPYPEDADGDRLRINAFDHDDVNVAFDPLSTYRIFPDTADLAVLELWFSEAPSIDVMIPDCLLPPVGGGARSSGSPSPRHPFPGISYGMSDSVPASNLDQALCPNSLAPTLGLQRREYWEEINPLLAKWKSVNDTRCPECARMIRVNMACHLQLVHSDYVCFWRCPVASCSFWFTSELNTKDHIENIHRFREGRGTSLYECLRTYGLEWFGSRKFFDGRRSANQALWMDLVLVLGPVRSSGTTTSSRGARITPHCAGSSTPPSNSSKSYTTCYWSPLPSPSPVHSLRRCEPQWRTVMTYRQRGA